MHSFPLYKLFDNPNLDPPKPIPLGALQCDLVTEIEKKKKKHATVDSLVVTYLTTNRPVWLTIEGELK